MSEFSLIDVFFKTPALLRDEVVYGIGDDAACLRVPAGQDLFVSTDTLVADVHFLTTWDAYDIAWKAVMVNVSDMAAMAAMPCWVSLALTLPGYDERWLKRFSEGLHAALASFSLSLIGGDTTRGPLSMTLTIHGLAPRGKGIRRVGAKPDDLIWVSGDLGAAALAVTFLQRQDVDRNDSRVLMDKLQHPRARTDLIPLLRRFASSAIDISDGLSADLAHICEASGVGACLSRTAIPVHPLVTQYLGEAAIDFSLGGGDDYELCFTTASSVRDELVAECRESGVTCYPVGVIEAMPTGLSLWSRQGILIFRGQTYDCNKPG